MSDEQRERFKEHLYGEDRLDDRIRADPQGHIDELVAAGVLQRVIEAASRSADSLYRVVPKVHISYERIEARYGDWNRQEWLRWTCPEHSPISHGEWMPHDEAVRSAALHGARKHPYSAIKFGSIPKPPHKHDYTWQLSPEQLWHPFCPCGQWLADTIGGARYIESEETK